MSALPIKWWVEDRAQNKELPYYYILTEKWVLGIQRQAESRWAALLINKTTLLSIINALHQPRPLPIKSLLWEKKYLLMLHQMRKDLRVQQLKERNS